MFDWVNGLAGLPAAVAMLVVAAAIIIIIVTAFMRLIFRRVIDPIVTAHKESTEVMKSAVETNSRAVSANTEAVREEMKHNERIISNHLSGQEAREKLLLVQMTAVAESIRDANARRRRTDLTDCPE